MVEEYKFDFERLNVYKKAVEFANELFNVSRDFSSKMQSSLGDQLRRAGISICNNIAEGSGKKSKNAKRQFYTYSLDSARECIPIITLALKQKEISKEKAEILRRECITICNMLGKLIYSLAK
jgi:four helix bundle protein